MSRTAYRYQFNESVSAQDIEESLQLAILGAEGLHGPARVRLEASYHLDNENNTCVVDATTDVGRDVCRLFTGFAIREFGEGAFTVRKAGGKSEPELNGATS